MWDYVILKNSKLVVKFINYMENNRGFDFKVEYKFVEKYSNLSWNSNPRAGLCAWIGPARRRRIAVSWALD